MFWWDMDLVIDWLMQGDPSIRWQVMRDLLDLDEAVITEERNKVASTGWGMQLLSHQAPSGLWGGQLYNNKWLSTTYTLLLLRQMGLEPTNRQAQLGCQLLLDGGFKATGAISYAKTVETIDIAVNGIVLSILAYFGYPDDRVHHLAEYLVKQQLPDGRWEPFADNQNLRYTLDTVLLVLDGLHQYQLRYPGQSSIALQAQLKGMEFLLAYKIFKNPATGVAIDQKMTLFSFPPRWHYDVLAALDYFQTYRASKDNRIIDALSLLESKHNPDGTWNLQNRHAGKTFFEMGQIGKPSRWNTLRALRVLSWWNGS